MAVIVPTLHPAALLRGRDDDNGMAKYEQTVVNDIGKALRLTRELPRWDERVIWERDSVGRLKNLFPTPEEVIGFVAGALGTTVATDTETTGEQVMVAQLMCAGYASSNGRAICVPFLRRGGSKYWAPHDETRVRAALAQLNADATTTKVIHNKPFDKIVYWLNGMSIAGPVEDTMQLHHVIDSELPNALGYCASTELDSRFWKDDVKGDEGWLFLDDTVLRSYNLRDCLSTLGIFPPFMRRCRQLGLEGLYREELALTEVMMRATVRGLAVDFWRRDCETESIPVKDKKGNVVKYQKGLGPRLRDQMNLALAQLKFLAGRDSFDPMKPAQLKEFLFDRMRFPIVKMSKSGLHPSTDKEAMVLLALAAGTPAQKASIKALADFKQGQKFLSTFVEGLKTTGDGRLHVSWKLLTTSGRFATSPNAQNWRKNVKAIFCAGNPRFGPDDVSDEEFTGVDLKQAEMRGIAYDADDQRLLEMYAKDLNVHTVNLAMSLKVRPPIGHKDLDPATQQYIAEKLPIYFPGATFAQLGELDGNALKAGRTLIKNDGFGRNYGGEDEVVFSIMRSARDPDTNELLFPGLRRSEVEANGILWRKLNTGIVSWWHRLQTQVKARGYYQCPISGRIRWFRAGFKKNDILGTPIQTLIASFMNKRTLEIQAVFDAETGGQAQVIQQVHDALNSVGPKSYSKRAAEVKKEILSRPIALPRYPNAVFPPDDVLFGSHLDEV